VVIVAGEVEDGVANDDIGENVGERVCFDGFNPEVLRRKMRRKPANGVDGLRIGIYGEDVVAFTEKVDDVPAAAAARIENFHPG
jgi:hypothetical protein